MVRPDGRRAALPAVRRFMSSAITEDDVETFCKVLDATCRQE